MFESDLARIESELEIPLPSGYREFLLRETDEVERIATLLPLRPVLWTNPDDIIRENLEVRGRAMEMTIGEELRPWPIDNLLVGTNVSGDYWFIHRDGSPPGLWFWDHGMKDVELVNADFSEYMKNLRLDATNPTRWQPPKSHP